MTQTAERGGYSLAGLENKRAQAKGFADAQR